MLVERTITQLQQNPGSPERAREMGQLGYMQWLGGLPGGASYEREAEKAWLKAAPFIETDPAIAVFCGLIRESLRPGFRPLEIALPKPRRRGGARRRRVAC